MSSGLQQSPDWAEVVMMGSMPAALHLGVPIKAGQIGQQRSFVVCATERERERERETKRGREGIERKALTYISINSKGLGDKERGWHKQHSRDSENDRRVWA